MLSAIEDHPNGAVKTHRQHCDTGRVRVLM